MYFFNHERFYCYPFLFFPSGSEALNFTYFLRLLSLLKVKKRISICLSEIEMEEEMLELLQTCMLY